jgi:RND superfamily putative drug exporter
MSPCPAGPGYGPPVPVGLVELVLRRPGAVLMAAVTVTVGLLAALSALPHGLPASGFEVDGSESQRAENTLVRTLGHEPEPGLLILAQGQDLTDRVFEVGLGTVRSQLRANPEVATVQTTRSGAGRKVLFEVFFRDLEVDQRQWASDEITESLDPGPLTIVIGGQERALLEGRDEARDDGVALGLTGLVLGALLLLPAVGWRFALTAALGALAALGTAELVNLGPDVSIVSVPPAVVIAVVLALEGTVLQCVQYRWELAAGSSPARSVRRAVDASRRPIVLAALAATVVFGAAALLPMGYGPSIDIAGGAAALLTGITVLLVIPAGLGLFGWSLVRPRRSHGGWVGGRPWLTVPFGILAVLAVAIPLRDAQTVAFDSTYLPASSEPVRAERAIDREFGPGRSAPVVIAARPQAVRTFAREVESVPGVAGVSVGGGQGAESRLVAAHLEDPPGSRAAAATVERIRHLPLSAPLGVGGLTARAVDGPDETLDRLPLAGIVALGAVIVLLVLGSGSWRGAALGLLSPLGAGAAAGAALFVFADGRLSSLLGYTPRDGIQLAVLITGCAALFAVGAARSALAAGRPHGPAAGPRFPAAPAALLSTAALVAGSAGLVVSDLLTVKEFGLVIGVGALVDLLLVRLLAEGGIVRSGGR